MPNMCPTCQQQRALRHSHDPNDIVVLTPAGVDSVARATRERKEGTTDDEQKSQIYWPYPWSTQARWEERLG